MSGILSPAEVREATVKAGERKANLRFWPMFLLAVLAGVFIGLGGVGSIIATSTGTEFGKFLGPAIFPVGLILVVIAGAELFTGNNLMMLAKMEGKITWRKLFRNWTVVYIGNLVGSLLLAEVIYFSGILSPEAIEKSVTLAENKVGLEVAEMILRGVLCNILVVLAVWMATAARDAGGKILAIWFPVMLFVYLGFEHSVANMFFLPLGLFNGAEISVVQILANLGFVTIGNLIGGAVFVPLIYKHVR